MRSRFLKDEGVAGTSSSYRVSEMGSRIAEKLPGSRSWVSMEEALWAAEFLACVGLAADLKHSVYGCRGRWARQGCRRRRHRARQKR